MRWLLVLALAGCYVPSPTEKDSLQEQVRAWHDDVRWARWQQASMKLPPAKRKRFMEQTRALQDDVDMSNYEINSVQPAGDARVDVKVTLEWVSKNTGLLRKTELAETWVRVGSEWIVSETRQEHGEKLPFFEPAGVPVDAGAPPPDAQK